MRLDDFALSLRIESLLPCRQTFREVATEVLGRLGYAEAEAADVVRAIDALVDGGHAARPTSYDLRFLAQNGALHIRVAYEEPGGAEHALSITRRLP